MLYNTFPDDISATTVGQAAQDSANVCRIVPAAARDTVYLLGSLNSINGQPTWEL